MEQPAADADVLVACRDLRKHFQVRGRAIRVLEGIDLAVRGGQIVVVTGKTGSGKSTLLGLLGGLDRPSSGEVWLEGRRVDHLAGAEWSAIRRRKIGILFQNFNLLPSWTARENVEAAMLHTDMARSARRERAQALLSAVGLEDRADHLPSELSIGQQQLVAIARAIANEPSVLLADEPTGDVDPAVASEIVSRLARPVKTQGAALFVVTHGPYPLDQADQAFRLENGTLQPVESAPAGS